MKFLLLAALLCAVAAMAAEFKPLDPKVVPVPGDTVPAASPVTYPDEAGFQTRGKFIVDVLAKEDLGKWRRGYFSGGDPGKYLPGAAMARLLLDPNDAEARKYMNDNRSPKELYHFAIVNWARFYPLFGEALADETKRTLNGGIARAGMLYSDGGRGTENHIVMQVTSGVVLPDYTGQKGQQDKAKAWLRDYVKNLYRYGQGEWDSSSYLLFDINGLLNIYDFSKDEECRLLARAGLDWFATAYAVKYVNGMHTGPKERGWSSGSVETIIDQAGWLWWGADAEVTEKHISGQGRYAMGPYTSAYRPNAIISRIARREVALPTEMRNSKPNYWTGLDKPPITPVLNESQESLYITPHYTLGTMWFAEDTCTQLMRLQLGAKTKDGAVSFSGSAPGSYNGDSRYGSGHGTHIVRPSGDVDPKTVGCDVQYAQVGSTVICMAEFGKDVKEPFTYFTTPVPAEKKGDWYVMQAGETFVGVRPLTVTAEPAELGKMAALKFPGAKSGFILQVADTTQYTDIAAFAAALATLKLDVSQWEAKSQVTVAAFDGRTVQMAYAKGKKNARTTIDGKAVSFDNWPVYDGKYVTQKDGALTVNDGTEGFVIDFSGDKPVYKAWVRG